jgi:23S rRNA (cytidine1920-2'-O)/16S rRNA (cytidine1409-2'-O)-methyltransferase
MYVNDKNILKPSHEIPENLIEDVDFTIKRICDDSFVSIGGFKLKKALNDFNFDVTDLVCVDLGASTGGFTDCLLKNGAKKVFAVDLNDDLLHHSLKENEKVIPIIKNAKLLTRTDFKGEKPNLFTCDLSFISATQILPTISRLSRKGTYVILLIKPQFEMGKKCRFKNGIIRDDKMRRMVCENVVSCARDCGLYPKELTFAPKYDDKNLEFLVIFQKGVFDEKFKLDEYIFS